VVTDTTDELSRKALSCILRGAAGERGFDALLAMRQAEAIVKALKIGRYEIKRVSR